MKRDVILLAQEIWKALKAQALGNSTRLQKNRNSCTLLLSLLEKTKLSELTEASSDQQPGKGCPANLHNYEFLLRSHKDIGKKSHVGIAEAFAGPGACQGDEPSHNLTKSDLQDTAENPY